MSSDRLQQKAKEASNDYKRMFDKKKSLNPVSAYQGRSNYLDK